MAPKLASRFTIIALVIVICLSAVTSPASASATLQEHVFKFYLDPALAPDMDFARTALPKYVADLNAILAKNTNRRLVFDPQTGILLTSTKPQTDSAQPPLPTERFEIWAYAVHTDNSMSFGGYAGMDKSGAGVLAGLKWTRIYDPDSLASGEVTDYTLQLDHMLHELAHVFGAGIGEYYNLATVKDTTTVEPLLNISLLDPADSFWSDKQDFMTDPLLRFTHASTRGDYLGTVEYSNLTAAVLNGPYRNGVPSFDHFTIRVLDANGSPMPQAQVDVWNVMGGSPYASQLLFDGPTDENGEILLPWDNPLYAHSSSNFLRLIKVYKDGAPFTAPRYVSIFDLDEASLVSKETGYTVTLQAAADQPTPPVTSSTATVASNGKLDGWVLESAPLSNRGGYLNAASPVFLLGDDSANRQYRSVLSFNTTSLPKNAVFTKVTLRIMKQGLVGTDPFGTHGAVRVDIRQGYFGSTAGMQLSDFQAQPSLIKAGFLASQAIDGWYSAELDAPAYGFINLSGITQLRLQFQVKNNGDASADYLKFFSGNSADPAKRPQLIVEYYLP